MKKGYVIGGLAVLGAIALISWYKKPKRNSEGFFGANGRMSRGRRMNKTTGDCYICRTSPTSLSGYYATNGYCRQGDYCSRTKKQFEQG